MRVPLVITGVAAVMVGAVLMGGLGFSRRAAVLSGGSDDGVSSGKPVVNWEQLVDYDSAVSLFGAPDKDQAGDHEAPRAFQVSGGALGTPAPIISVRWITYNKQHVMFMLLTGEKLGAQRPYLWRLCAVLDSRTAKSISVDALVARFLGAARTQHRASVETGLLRSLGMPR